MEYATLLWDFLSVDANREKFMELVKALPDDTTLILGPKKVEIKKPGKASLEEIYSALEAWEPENTNVKGYKPQDFSPRVRYFAEKYAGDGKSEVDKPIIELKRGDDGKHQIYLSYHKDFKSQVSTLDKDKALAFLSDLRRLSKKVELTVFVFGEKFNERINRTTVDRYIAAITKGLGVKVGAADSEDDAGGAADDGRSADYFPALKQHWDEKGLADVNIRKYFAWIDKQEPPLSEERAKAQLDVWAENIRRVQTAVSNANEVRQGLEGMDLNEVSDVDAKIAGLTSKEELLAFQITIAGLRGELGSTEFEIEESQLPPALDGTTDWSGELARALTDAGKFAEIIDGTPEKVAAKIAELEEIEGLVRDIEIKQKIAEVEKESGYLLDDSARREIQGVLASAPEDYSDQIDRQVTAAETRYLLALGEDNLEYADYFMEQKLPLHKAKELIRAWKANTSAVEVAEQAVTDAYAALEVYRIRKPGDVKTRVDGMREEQLIQFKSDVGPVLSNLELVRLSASEAEFPPTVGGEIPWTSRLEETQDNVDGLKAALTDGLLAAEERVLTAQISRSGDIMAEAGIIRSNSDYLLDPDAETDIARILSDAPQNYEEQLDTVVLAAETRYLAELAGFWAEGGYDNGLEYAGHFADTEVFRHEAQASMRGWKGSIQAFRKAGQQVGAAYAEFGMDLEEVEAHVNSLSEDELNAFESSSNALRTKVAKIGLPARAAKFPPSLDGTPDWDSGITALRERAYGLHGVLKSTVPALISARREELAFKKETRFNALVLDRVGEFRDNNTCLIDDPAEIALRQIEENPAENYNTQLERVRVAARDRYRAELAGHWGPGGYDYADYFLGLEWTRDRAIALMEQWKAIEGAERAVSGVRDELRSYGINDSAGIATRVDTMTDSQLDRFEASVDAQLLNLGRDELPDVTVEFPLRGSMIDWKARLETVHGDRDSLVYALRFAPAEIAARRQVLQAERKDAFSAKVAVRVGEYKRDYGYLVDGDAIAAAKFVDITSRAEEGYETELKGAVKAARALYRREVATYGRGKAGKYVDYFEGQKLSRAEAKALFKEWVGNITAIRTSERAVAAARAQLKGHRVDDVDEVDDRLLEMTDAQLGALRASAVSELPKLESQALPVAAAKFPPVEGTKSWGDKLEEVRSNRQELIAALGSIPEKVNARLGVLGDQKAEALRARVASRVEEYRSANSHLMDGVATAKLADIARRAEKGYEAELKGAVRAAKIRYRDGLAAYQGGTGKKYVRYFYEKKLSRSEAETLMDGWAVNVQAIENAAAVLKGAQVELRDYGINDAAGVATRVDTMTDSQLGRFEASVDAQLLNLGRDELPDASGNFPPRGSMIDWKAKLEALRSDRDALVDALSAVPGAVAARRQVLKGESEAEFSATVEDRVDEVRGGNLFLVEGDNIAEADLLRIKRESPPNYEGQLRDIVAKARKSYLAELVTYWGGEWGEEYAEHFEGQGLPRGKAKETMDSWKANISALQNAGQLNSGVERKFAGLGVTNLEDIDTALTTMDERQLHALESLATSELSTLEKKGLPDETATFPPVVDDIENWGE